MDNSDFLEKEAEQSFAGGKETVEIMKSIFPLLGQIKSITSKVHKNDGLSVFSMILQFLMYPLPADTEIKVIEAFLTALKDAKEFEESKEKEKLH